MEGEKIQISDRSHSPPKCHCYHFLYVYFLTFLTDSLTSTEKTSFVYDFAREAVIVKNNNMWSYYILVNPAFFSLMCLRGFYVGGHGNVTFFFNCYLLTVP